PWRRPAPPRARGTPGPRRRAGWRAARRGRAVSCGLQVIVPEVDVHGVARGSLRAPQLARGEAHGVAVLRLAAEAVTGGVGEHPYAVIQHHLAALAARIAGQPR